MNLHRSLPLAALLSLAACGAESPSPSPVDASAPTDAAPDALMIFPGMPGAAPCPSASIAAGSLWPDVVCDRGAGDGVRFVTVETCAMETRVYRPLTMARTITSSHPYERTCPGVRLVTLNDATNAYLGP